MKNVFSNKKVSVIIPAYNASKYLRDCIESVINQSYKFIEIIVINDGSTDDTFNIAKEYSKKDNRILIINQKNSGVFSSRINGIKASSGEYLFFLDADDFLEEKCIEKLYIKSVNLKCDIVRCNFKNYKNGKFFVNKFKAECGFFYKESYENHIYKYIFLSFDFNSVCMQLISKKVAEKCVNIVSDLKYGEDLIFNCNLIKNSESLMLLDDALYIYRNNKESYTKLKGIDVINNRIHDILEYSNLLEKNINKWDIKCKTKFYGYLSNLMLKNIIYQLLYTSSKNEYVDIIDKFKYNDLYIDIKRYKPVSLNSIKEKVMLHLEKKLRKGNINLLYFELQILKRFI